MVTESVILTCLPNGVDGSGRLRVTMFTTPRLSTDGPSARLLKDFPSFIDWPRSVRRLVDEGRLAVEFDGLGPVQAEIDPDSPALDDATWAMVFDPDKVGVFASSPPAGEPG